MGKNLPKRAQSMHDSAPARRRSDRLHELAKPAGGASASFVFLGQAGLPGERSSLAAANGCAQRPSVTALVMEAWIGLSISTTVTI